MSSVRRTTHETHWESDVSVSLRLRVGHRFMAPSQPVGRSSHHEPAVHFGCTRCRLAPATNIGAE